MRSCCRCRCSDTFKGRCRYRYRCRTGPTDGDCGPAAAPLPVADKRLVCSLQHICWFVCRIFGFSGWVGQKPFPLFLFPGRVGRKTFPTLSSRDSSRSDSGLRAQAKPRIPHTRYGYQVPVRYGYRYLFGYQVILTVPGYLLGLLRIRPNSA